MQIELSDFSLIYTWRVFLLLLLFLLKPTFVVSAHHVRKKR